MHGILDQRRGPYKRHIHVPERAIPGRVRMSNICLIRGDQGRAVRALLDRIADKWALLILATLHGQRLRFTQLQQRIPGISQRMLTLTLRKLERDGLVSRTAHAEVPPRVEYEPTDLASSLIPHAIALAGWAAEHNPTIAAHRDSYDSRSDSSKRR
jgi:DNA-binding HxlR family transcriptional regulator